MSYLVDGVDVRFANRDITQATDSEIAAIAILLMTEKRDAGRGRTVTEMLIETDYIGLFSGRYRLTTLVEAEGNGPVDEDSSDQE